MSTPLPNLLLAGVPKAGTTSLFAYLAQHPDIVGSEPKELDYFTPLRLPGAELGPVSSYAAHVAHGADARYRMDGSPSYTVGGAVVADAVREVLGTDVRIVVILRDPVARFWSAYTFARSGGHLPDVTSCDEFISACELRREDPTPYALGDRRLALPAGAYDEYLGPWLERFGDDLQVVFADDLFADASGVVRDLLRWLDLDPDALAGLDTTARNRTVQPRSQLLDRVVYGTKDRLGGVVERVPAVRRGLRRAYGWINTTELDETLQPHTRERLEHLYADSCRRTAELLRAHGYDALPPWLTAPTGSSV